MKERQDVGHGGKWRKMEENGGKRGKMRKLQEGNAGKPKGMLDTESSRCKKK